MGLFDKDTKTITITKIINLKAIREEIISFQNLANEITFIDYSKIKGLTDDMKGVLDKENSERELIKADLLENKRIKQEELDSYD